MVMSRIFLSPPHVGEDERRLLLEALDSNWVAPIGPDVDAFEREVADVCGSDHGVALSSGTAALHLALRMLGITTGDVVLAPTLTFVATVTAIPYLGAEPVFLDVETGTWNLDPELLADELKAAAQRRRVPKALITVDLYGQCADYERIVPLCEHYGVALVEDAAEALGASRGSRPAGSFGVMSAMSFNGNKIITTSGGGMLLTNQPELADRARHLATQARSQAAHYEHEELGYNYRLSNLLAAFGRGQLRSLDQRVQRRRDIFEHYQQALGHLPGVSFITEDPAGRSNRWLSVLTVDPKSAGTSREQIRLALANDDIEARPVWKPMHLQPVFGGATARLSGVSDRLFRDGLCLPSGSSLTDAEQGSVITSILACFGS